MPKSRGYRISTRRYLLTMRILHPQVYRWASIAVPYPPLQRCQISPSSRQSLGKNLLGRIRPHRPMVTTDQPRPSSHLLFLHFISRPIKCISPSSDSVFFRARGYGGRRVPVILERIWSIVTPAFGLQRCASHDLPKVP